MVVVAAAAASSVAIVKAACERLDGSRGEIGALTAPRLFNGNLLLLSLARRAHLQAQACRTHLHALFLHSRLPCKRTVRFSYAKHKQFHSFSISRSLAAGQRLTWPTHIERREGLCMRNREINRLQVDTD